MVKYRFERAAATNVLGRNTGTQPGRQSNHGRMASVFGAIAAILVGSLIQVSIAESQSAVANTETTTAADAWLAGVPENSYTIQLATIYGAERCQMFAAKYSGESVFCLQSSEVANRWFAVRGVYPNKAAAKQAAVDMGIEDAWINYLPRIIRTRCEMANASQFFPATCGGAAASSTLAAAASADSESADLAPLTEDSTAGDASAGEHAEAAHNDEQAAQVADHGAANHHGATAAASSHKKGHHEPRLSSVPKPYLTEKELGKRTAPLIEWGGDFLGTGNIRRGFVLPTGAVWTPRFWVYGTGRSALQTFDSPGATNSSSEWVNQLNLFGNLQLSGTERLLVGIRPLNRDASFTGYTFSPDSQEGSYDEFNADIRTLFFEGDLAEIFPKWDRGDGKKNDIGFSIGRQDVLFQDGMTINDNLDLFGLSKNNIRFEGVPWLVNWRSSVLYAWNGVNRENNQEDEDAELYAWFNQWDTLKSTIDLDLIYVDSEAENSDQFVAAVNFIQRLGKIGSTFRIAHSVALDEESAVAGDGTLLFGEFNYVPAYTHDNMYLNVFAAIDNYTSAARDPLGGGPLGRVGLLYAASGLGSYPAPLSNRANDAYGFSAGYQKINDKKRRQLTFEVGARDSDFANGRQYGIAGRFQQALGKRFVLQLDGFIADQEGFDSTYGARLELLLKL